jgi:hypothetical protein
MRGLDVTRTLADHRRRQPDIFVNAIADALPVLRNVLSFLREHARIPHLRLLPRSFVMEALSRFFAVHPEPQARSLNLLARWVWRVLLSEGTIGEKTLRRRSVAAIAGVDEEATVQALLRLVPSREVALALPERFDPRAAQTRLALLGLLDLGPKSLVDGATIDVPCLLESRGAEAFRPVIPVRPRCPAGLHGPANRILLPGSGNARQAILKYIGYAGTKNAMLESHAIDDVAARALEAGDEVKFIEARAALMRAALSAFGSRLTGWARNDRDRPSIEYLLRLAGT